MRFSALNLAVFLRLCQFLRLVPVVFSDLKEFKERHGKFGPVRLVVPLTIQKGFFFNETYIPIIRCILTSITLNQHYSNINNNDLFETKHKVAAACRL